MTPAPFSRTFFDLLREQSARYPDAVAVIADDKAFSYAELLVRAERTAAALHRGGIVRGDRVGIITSNRIEWMDLCFGAAAVGATLVPFSTWSTRRELDFLLGDSAIRVLVAQARFGDRDYASDLAALVPEPAGPRASSRYPKLERIVLFDAATSDPFERLDSFLAGSPAWQAHPPGMAAGAADDGQVLYTSGSSATPKAVRLRQHGIIENGYNIGERVGLRPGDRVFLSAPLFWSYGAANAVPATLTHGGALVLQERFEAGEALDLIERHGCTAIYTLPGMTAALIGHPAFRPERVRTLRTGVTIGSPQDFLAAAKGFDAPEFCNVYGATETYGNCCVTWHHWPLEKRASCQGTPLPGNDLRLVDAETGEPSPPGVPGSVEVRGYVSPGYSGASAEQNEAVFTADGFYRTGDLGLVDEDGAFVFVARHAEMIKRAGINISPAEVENILLLHPDVAQAGVVGVPDPERGELVVAFVVSRNRRLAADELFLHCRSVASKYKIPDRIEIRDALPVTPTGKLQRRALKADAASLTVKVRHG